MERRTRLLLLAGVKPLTADHRLLLTGRRYGDCPPAWLCNSARICPGVHVPVMQVSGELLPKAQQKILDADALNSVAGE
jgi:hypothetical protein